MEENEHERERQQVDASRARPAPCDQPHDERRAGEGGRPFGCRSKSEHRSGKRPPLAQCEQQTQREQRRREQVEPEDPRERVKRPQRDKSRQPRTPARPQRPDRDDSDELEGNHQERVRHPRRATTEERLEREQEHCRRRVLRVRIVAVQERVPPKPIQDRGIDAGDVEGEDEHDPGELEGEGQGQ